MTTTTFQFTHPGKGATARYTLFDDSRAVSIHTPWEGCDFAFTKLSDELCEFQFTHPGKGATGAGRYGAIRRGVSIHTPWEGCDAMVVAFLS